MRTQIIDELRKITKEEQILLEGNGQIDKELYQSETQKKLQSDKYIIDSKKLLKAGELLGAAPEARPMYEEKE